MNEFEKYRLHHKKISGSEPFGLIWGAYSSYPYITNDDPDKVLKLKAVQMLNHAAHHVANANHAGRK